MIDLESVIQEIIRLHIDQEGFLVQLHMAQFDEKQFEECMAAGKRYITLTRGSKMIDKRVAQFVLDMVDYTSMMAGNFHERGLPIAKKTMDAYIEVRNLADQILQIDEQAPRQNTTLPLPFID
jgi:hypothetical protein